MAFLHCDAIKSAFYTGTADDWSKIYIDPFFKPSTLYYYSETVPTTEGNFWHYVDGVPTEW